MVRKLFRHSRGGSGRSVLYAANSQPRHPAGFAEFLGRHARVEAPFCERFGKSALHFTGHAILITQIFYMSTPISTNLSPLAQNPLRDLACMTQPGADEERGKRIEALMTRQGEDPSHLARIMRVD